MIFCVSSIIYTFTWNTWNREERKPCAAMLLRCSRHIGFPWHNPGTTWYKQATATR